MDPENSQAHVPPQGQGQDPLFEDMSDAQAEPSLSAVINSSMQQLMPILDRLIAYIPSDEHQAALRQLQPEVLLGVVLACGLLLLFLFLRILFPSKKSAQAPVLLVGPCGAGKTGEEAPPSVCLPPGWVCFLRASFQCV